ncbi:AmmeMemoRadiSam system protein B [bacterium]|nr:AmmeMemoRadiSam system protein B [bacterium]
MKRSGWTVAFLVLGFCLSFCHQRQTVAARVRPAARAGQFYAYSATELREQVRLCMSKAGGAVLKGEIRGIWAPHAGYEYSGAIAAAAYRQVAGRSYDAVLVVGPSHYRAFRGAAVADWDSLATPLGRIAVDRGLVRALTAADPWITVVPGVDDGEHSVEVQLPFIQDALPGVPVVLMLTGDMPHDQADRIARAIAGACAGRRVLLVASSDMSHFPSASDARRSDAEVLAAVSKYDTKRILALEAGSRTRGIRNLDCALCGSGALVTVMLAARAMGADRAVQLAYAHSGDVTGDPERVVGYGAAAFVGPVGSLSKGGGNVEPESLKFTESEKKTLFRAARQGILAALGGQRPPEFNIESPNLLVKRGVFVTLENRGRLRGCIGHFEPDLPLFEIVSQMAVAAATQDYRFAHNPVTEREMKDIHIKISILSPLKKIDSVEEIEVGRHGIWVRQGMRSGTYLPEVAADMGWTREQFLESCCAEKAGLPPDAWKKGADIYVYTSQVLQEK